MSTDEGRATARRKRVHFMLDRLPWWMYPVEDILQWISCRVLGHEVIHFDRKGPFCAYCLRDDAVTTRAARPLDTANTEETHRG